MKRLKSLETMRTFKLVPLEKLVSTQEKMDSVMGEMCIELIMHIMVCLRIYICLYIYLS